jgi:hypothetical protein
VGQSKDTDQRYAVPCRAVRGPSEHPGAALSSLRRRDRTALRKVLIEAAIAADQDLGLERLAGAVAAAPLDAVPSVAVLHRLPGVVRRGLDGAPGVPDDVLSRLASAQHRAALHHLLVTAALDRIGRVFDGEGIAWAAMKGPVVAALFYAEAGSRAYGDLDLLVGRQDFPHAVRILEGLGHEHVIRDWPMAESTLAGQIELVGEGVHVDLHWHLPYSRDDRRAFGVDPEEMLERRRRVAVSGVTASTLDPVDTLLTLAFHAARAGGHRLIWLKDVERALAVEAADLDALVRRSRQYRCGPPIGLVLDRARTLLDAAVPEDVVRALAPVALLGAARCATALSHPVALHEGPTLQRALTRSVRSSFGTTVAAAPFRALRLAQRWLAPGRDHETDDPVEKLAFLCAVARSERP